MSNPKLIIIEGSAGTGKSTTTNRLREVMLSTTMMRLSGISKEISNSKMLSYIYHSNILSMIKDTARTKMNWVLDRSYLSEYVYTNLGYKDYSFETEFNILSTELNNLVNLYDVYVFVLKTTPEEYEKRLMRDKAEYHKFSVESSVEQQEEYIKTLDKLPKSIKTYTIDTTGLSCEDTVKSILSCVL